MCIAILNKKQSVLEKETLRNCWIANQDGAGMLYVKEGQMVIFKELKSFDRFYKQYLKAKEVTPFDMILHFRITTHGNTDLKNCHPFLVNSKLGFAHNGILDVDADKDKSDTRVFNETVLRNLPRTFYKNQAILFLLDEFCSGSKLVFLDNKGYSAIVNEGDGETDNEGNWYSNSSYKGRYVYCGSGNSYDYDYTTSSGKADDVLYWGYDTQGELVFYNADGDFVTGVNFCDICEKVYDEGEKCPDCEKYKEEAVEAMIDEADEEMGG